MFAFLDGRAVDQWAASGQGASAELVAMTTIGAADLLGLPVSTTQVLSSGVAGTMVITPCQGLRSPDVRVGVPLLRRYAGVDIDAADPRYRRPLVRDARALASALGAEAAWQVVLLGSVASAKYVEPLTEVFGERLVFPAEFVGRGDMSRGGLLLRCVADGRELDYVPTVGARRRGPRPAKLTPRPGVYSAAFRLLPPG
jgi:hypothetical protein